MPRFRVLVREIHVTTCLIDADTPEEAIEAVREGDGDFILSEYVETLSHDTWTVEAVKKDANPK